MTIYYWNARATDIASYYFITDKYETGAMQEYSSF